MTLATDLSFLNDLKAWERVQNIDTRDWDKQRGSVKPKMENWDKEIQDVEEYFATAAVPDHPIMVQNWLTIGDVPKFVRIEMEVVYANRGVPTFRPYLNRVVMVMNFLKDLAKMQEIAMA